KLTGRARTRAQTERQRTRHERSVMRVDWYGQAAFRLVGQDGTVFIDPFGDPRGRAASGMQFDSPPIEGVEADLLLVTHEHGDHNGVEVIGGNPAPLRPTAGTLQSPVGGGVP